MADKNIYDVVTLRKLVKSQKALRNQAIGRKRRQTNYSN